MHLCRHDHHLFRSATVDLPFILAGGMFLLALGFILQDEQFPPGPGS